MKASSENYKGIEFVRISMLPENQKNLIRISLKRDQIITILKNDHMLTDCVQKKDYERWYCENYKDDNPVTNTISAPISKVVKTLSVKKVLNLVIK